MSYVFSAAVRWLPVPNVLMTLIFTTLIRSFYEIQSTCFDPDPGSVHVDDWLGTRRTRNFGDAELDSCPEGRGLLSSRHGRHERRQRLLPSSCGRCQGRHVLLRQGQEQM